jgi:hypothetical protein
MNFRARLLFINATSEDPNYKAFQRERIRQDVIQSLQDKKIEIIVSTDVERPFKAILKDYEGDVILTLTTFEFGSFNKIFDAIDEAAKYNRALSRSGSNFPSPLNNKIGGGISYKHKYNKYKMKYLELQKKN